MLDLKREKAVYLDNARKGLSVPCLDAEAPDPVIYMGLDRNVWPSNAEGR